MRIPEVHDFVVRRSYVELGLKVGSCQADCRPHAFEKPVRRNRDIQETVTHRCVVTEKVVTVV